MGRARGHLAPTLRASKSSGWPVLWDVLWHGHPDQGAIHPSHIIYSPPPSSSPIPHPPPPASHHPHWSLCSRGAEWQQTTSWHGPQWLLGPGLGRTVHVGKAGSLPLRGSCSAGLQWPAGEWAEKHARVHPAQQPWHPEPPLKGLPAPTGRAAHRRYYTLAMKAASGTMTGEARGLRRPRPHLEGQGPDASEGRFTGRPWVRNGTQASWGWVFQGVWAPGSARTASQGAGLRSRAVLAWLAGLTLPGQDEDSMRPSVLLPWPGPGLRAPGGLAGSGREAGGPAAPSAGATVGPPGLRSRPGLWGRPTPAYIRQEAPLAREEALLAPASEILSRRGRVDGARHMGQAKETQLGSRATHPQPGKGTPWRPH